MRFLVVLSCFLLLGCVHADVYMHNPRGSNDRLAEPSANRNNAERLFDSQNNAKGGYSWGPGKMYFYVGSALTVEWTAQHSCGQENSDCDIVLQYMCNDDAVDPLRDGTPETDANQPNTPSYCDPQNPGACVKTTYQNKQTTGPFAGQFIYGLHESYDFYDKCYCRERNKGLFVADRNMNNNAGATATRQNNNGNNVRNTPGQNGGANHGYECPEERDYWPYWHPAPWRDIAILTTRTQDCATMQANSQNVREYGQCTFGAVNFPVNAQNQRQQGANNPVACAAQGGTWIITPPNGDPAPMCLPAPWSRDNHLGNGVGGVTNSFNWTIPNRPAQNCVLRLRYNITTRDTVSGKRFSTLTAGDNGVRSPVSQDPALFHSPNRDTNPTAQKLVLALDTAQTGRTFQDRSHAFEIRARPGSVDPSRRIFNLNVRGKRGNIVQAYPAVEYDFVPQWLHVKTGDYIHIQWTGALDGAYPGGQDGEGRDKTDRHNMVGLLYNEKGANLFYPLNNTGGVPLPFASTTHRDLAWISQVDCVEQENLAAIAQQRGQNVDQLVENCGKLNNASSAYYDAGLQVVGQAMSWTFISTRNNNFSNRSQKGIIVSENLVQTFGIVLLSISGAAFAAAIVIAVIVKLAPASSVAAAAVGV